MKLTDLFENYPFHSDTTEMPYYDDMIKADAELKDYFKKQKGLVWELNKMSPDDYINRVIKGFNTTKEKLMSGRDPEKVDDFAQQMRDGKKFPILTLDYSRNKNRVSQEGVHRSLAAKKAGVKEVPVLIVNSVD